MGINDWYSIYFTSLFLTMSSAKPRLLFSVEEEEDGALSFFSLPQLQNPYEKSTWTLEVAAEFHVKFSPRDFRIYHNNDLRYYLSCAYASGLIYFQGNRYEEGRPLVCNPNTGRYETLPYVHSYRRGYSFFGFEPIDKQYKVLSMAYYGLPGHQHKILTLGRDTRWRKIKCSLRHDIRSEGVCINGVLYYLGDAMWCHNDPRILKSHHVIVCFHLRSEVFTFIDLEKRFCGLINYKGKLAVTHWKYRDDYWDEYVGDIMDADDIDELHVWVLEDADKQEWSKYAYTCGDDKFFCGGHVSIAGVTAWGEIVFSMRKATFREPFYVFYFNPERNTLRRSEIQGFRETCKKPRSVRTFVNHAEDLNVNDLKLLKSVHVPFEGPVDLELDREGTRRRRKRRSSEL